MILGSHVNSPLAPWDFEYLILISVPEIFLFNTNKCCFSNGYFVGHILRNTVACSSSYFTSLPSCALFSTAVTERRFQGDKKGNFRMPSPLTSGWVSSSPGIWWRQRLLLSSSSHLIATPWFHLPLVDLGLSSRNITSSLCPYISRSERVFFVPLMFGLPHPLFWLLGYSLRFKSTTYTNFSFSYIVRMSFSFPVEV